MRTTSVFCAECICGSYFETEQPEYQCPHCNRLIVLAWGFVTDLEVETPKDSNIPEAAA